MRSNLRPTATALALLLIAGALEAGLPGTPSAREIQRAARLTQRMEATKATYGLGARDGLLATPAFTDAKGKVHVRYRQTYQGVEVWNGTLIGHMDAEGRVEPAHATVQQGIDLAPAALLSEDRIQSLIRTKLPKEGRLWPMRIRPIVFPTRYQDGLKVARNAQGELVFDPKYSVATPRKTAPYVWAFQVSTMQGTSHGLEGTEFIVDGHTGEVLKKWDGFSHADTPSKATGHSQYNGTVTLDSTLQESTGLYALLDTTRPSLPWPNLQYSSYDFPEFYGTGLRTVYYDPYGPNGYTSGTTDYTNATNAWGDGSRFDWLMDFPYEVNSPKGQTAAVDAHFSAQVTWDYYAQVLGRTGGIDGLGSSPVILVHADDPYGYSPNGWNNAAWDGSYFFMMYGDGGATGSLTTLDIGAHEMSHGVLDKTTNLSNKEEGGGLNEANSDVHATMVKFWQWGAGGAGSTIPDATTTAPVNDPLYPWTIAPQLSADGLTPMRWLYKPSKDGHSFDAWFDGMGLDDLHYAMGPGNRAFYFLSQGASSDPTKDTHSDYLPAGMTGIGNDKAIRIWWQAMTTKVTDTFTDYHAFRGAMLEAAAELYPGAGAADSSEVAAVKNAFAAVNLGAPAGGPEPISVTFPVMPMADEIFYKSKVIILPSMVPALLPTPTVAHTTDTRLDWSVGGLSQYTEGGRFLDDGRFVAPMTAYGWTWPVKATSKADPKQFAVNLVMGAPMDCDSDSETDACDLGAIALAYYGALVGFDVYPAAAIYSQAYYGADDLSCQLFTLGFHNAYTH